MKVLIIKLTSMGDVIHTLPALTDANKQLDDVRFDWLVEEPFREIPTWHRSVDNVFTVALRRWRKNIFAKRTLTGLKMVWKACREQRYDLIIDAQGLIKSAMLSCLARGKRCGYDAYSAREFGASMMYHQRVAVAKKQHAVRRVRELFAKALSYSVPLTAPDYGIKKQFPVANPNKDYLLFLHGTTWASKHWPEDYWRKLIELANDQQRNVLLAWGGATEKRRADMLAKNVQHACVLPKKSLTELAHIIVGAEGVVAVDTGLAHLAAALEVPTVSIYGPTDAALTGTVGAHQLHLQTDFSCSPCLQRHCQYQSSAEQRPACFTTLPPSYVWQQLTALLKG